MTAKLYREPVEVTGSVTQINTECRTFTIGTDGGLPVKAPYTEESKHRVFQVAQNPQEWLIRVSGLGEFTRSGALERFVKADSITIAVARWERGEVDPNAPTITEMFDAIVAETPPEAWEGVPTDLSRRHDFYLYGVDTSEN